MEKLHGKFSAGNVEHMRGIEMSGFESAFRQVLTEDGGGRFGWIASAPPGVREQFENMCRVLYSIGFRRGEYEGAATRVDLLNQLLSPPTKPQ